jgi:hypothetical protein
MTRLVANTLPTNARDQAVRSASLRLATRGAQVAKPPVNTAISRQSGDAGGGTRTPDTRIMIPLL